ncbi:thioredoxin family protein [bacterium]|nr:thioredoxin family protein [bacterium]
MFLLESLNLPLRSPAQKFSLPGIDGKVYSLDDFIGKRALIIIFMCNHCPYVQGVIQRLITLQKEFKDDKVAFIGVNANDSINYPEDSFEKMSDYAKKWGLNFPYLRDESQEVAKKYKAQCTPDIFVYDKDLKLAYHGRIDDNWQDEDKVTTRELKDVIEALLNDKKLVEKQNPSMGCSIKWKNQ